MKKFFLACMLVSLVAYPVGAVAGADDKSDGQEHESGKGKCKDRTHFTDDRNKGDDRDADHGGKRDRDDDDCRPQVSPTKPKDKH